MAGRPKTRMFVYNCEGKFIETLESTAAFRKKYFPRVVGKLPVLNYTQLGCNFNYYPKLDIFVSDKRIGRDNVRNIIAIEESEYCKRQDDVDTKPVDVINLKGDVIATFKTQRLLSVLVPSIKQSNVSRHLSGKRTAVNKSQTGLYFAFSPVSADPGNTNNSDNIIDRLRSSLIGNILNAKEDKLDENYLVSSSGTFTRRELANEIQNNTEVGMRQFESVLKLTLYLLEKGNQTI